MQNNGVILWIGITRVGEKFLPSVLILELKLYLKITNQAYGRHTDNYYVMNIDDVKIIQLPKLTDPRGNLSFAEQKNHIPFEIKRTYWIYDVPGGESRGGHAYKEAEEFIIALSGAFDVIVDDGINRKTFTLNRSYFGLYIPKGLWREMTNFSTNSFALEFASTLYSEKDYIRDYNEFVKFSGNEKA